MEITELSLPGCYRLGTRVVTDGRGRFVKPFQASEFAAHGLRADFTEQYYSTSCAGVIRGMHYQRPPHEHAKLVYCASGAVRDVLLDLRKNSPSYGRYAVLELEALEGGTVYIAAGVAHGFTAMEDASLVVYNVTSEYAPEHDEGVRWDSFGYDWAVAVPVISARDRCFTPLNDFNSPF